MHLHALRVVGVLTPHGSKLVNVLDVGLHHIILRVEETLIILYQGDYFQIDPPGPV